MEQEVLEYLDRLRESGVTNMFGATPYIVREFDISRKEASELLIKWMKKNKLPLVQRENDFNVAKNQLAHVKLQGATGEYRYALIRIEKTTDIRSTLDDMELGDFKLAWWKLINVDYENIFSRDT